MNEGESVTGEAEGVHSPVIPEGFRYRRDGVLAEGRVLVIACGAIAKEIIAVVEANDWRHMEIACLPAIWHNRPEKIPEGVREKIREAKASGRYSAILVGYGDCGTGGLLDKVLAEEGGIERLPGDHCYAFFSGTRQFEETFAGEIETFYLTDFLVRQFDAMIWRGLGLAKHPELRDMYFHNYRKLVYLAQTDDPDLDRRAEEAAERLALPLEIRRTGYGDLVGSLGGLAGKGQTPPARLPRTGRVGFQTPDVVSEQPPNQRSGD
ncbi:MAG: DUF1638 domain-containing protein [Rhizobiales bacterium]|nr:DUF1638 domain-containing protein [Hyphomicrobiales bacterium]